MRNRGFLTTIILILAIAGCAKFKSPGDLPWLDEDTWKWILDDDTKPIVPQKLVGIWTDTVYYQSGAMPTRGFGGRIYFYDEFNKPCCVAGELVVYAFDDARDAEASGRKGPQRKYVFPVEQFGEHYSLSEIGHSYSVWIPWDAVGGEQAEITLVPFFKPNGGSVVVGESTKHVLPGKNTPLAKPWRQQQQRRPLVDAQALGQAVRPASFDQPFARPIETAETERAESTMQTTTITLPPELSRRWARTQSSAATRVNTTATSRLGTPQARPTVAPTRVAAPPSTDSQPRQRPAPRVAPWRESRDRAPWRRSPSTQPSAPAAPLPAE
jgi:hypothetical protein